MDEAIWKILSSKFVVAENGCWEWIAAKTMGYGMVFYKGKVGQAHRLAYIGAVGDSIGGKDIHHECRNKVCINPDHLVALTHAEHSTLENKRKTHCIKGHPFTNDNTTICQTKSGQTYRRCDTCYRENSRNRYLSKPFCSRRLLPSDNTSGRRWVSWSTSASRWQTVIAKKHFGIFKDIDEAAYVADQVAIQLYDPDIKCNILTGPSLPWPSQTVDAT